ncbi:MAG: hypothetical protein H6733_13130 [Alphaproteobacteria bacterium]|nr:hypothetical protein [Alphaproteobacteria bacterium]
MNAHRLLVASLVLAGCANQRTPPAATSPTPPAVVAHGTITPVAPSPEGDAAPDGSAASDDAARWAPLALRLRARDAEDLPDADALRAVDDVVTGLAWLTVHGEPVYVRTRAAERLGLLVDEAGTLQLVALAGDAATPVEVRLGAVAGLAHQLGPDITGGPAVDALVAAAADADPRVATEAIAALRVAPSTWPALRALAEAGRLAPEAAAQVRALDAR